MGEKLIAFGATTKWSEIIENIAVFKIWNPIYYKLLLYKMFIWNV